MTISSRTPDGRPNRCPVCRKRLRLSPSWPTADAPCPHCGSLVWFPAKAARLSAQPTPPGEFTLDQFRKQFEQMKKLGSMPDPLAQMADKTGMDAEGEDPEAAIRRIQGIIDAMTQQERRNPDTIDASRQRRIAVGAGCAA